MQDICERNKSKGNEDRGLWRSDVMRECLDLALRIGSESCRCPVSAEH